MGRIIGFLFGLLAYAVFFGTFLYAVGFVSGVAVPKTIDSGPVAPVAQALVINILLMSLFAVQHSVMARKPFKRWWTRFIPAMIERSTYVLLASLVLILLFWQWHPMPQIVWEITNPRIAAAVMGVSFAGWLLVLVSTFLSITSSCSGCTRSRSASRAARCPRPASRPRRSTSWCGIRSISVSSSRSGQLPS